MDKIPLFPDFFEVFGTDLNAISTLGQDAIDGIVREMGFAEGRYSGLPVAKTSASQISVGTGVYYRDGKRYRKAAPTSYSLTSLLPGSLSRIVLVVVLGQDVETDTQTRKKLIDVTTMQTLSQSVATRRAREAVIDLVAGTASASPARPPVPAGAIVIASMTVNSSGIVGNPAMEASTTLLSLGLAFATLSVLAETDRKYASAIQSLGSDLAALRKEVGTKAPQTTVNHILSDVLELREGLAVPDTSSFYGFDTFSNDDESDTAFAGYTAKVEAAVLQHGDIEKSSALSSLLNPADPRVDVSSNGLVIPKWKAFQRFSAGDADEAISIANYPVATVVGKQLKMTKTWRFKGGMVGESAVYEKLKKDPRVNLVDPETGETVVLDMTRYQFTVRQMNKGNSPWYELKVTGPYWEHEATTIETTGARVAQTFQCGLAGWYTQFDVWFEDLGANQNVRLSLCECRANGQPDLNRILAQSVIERASLKIKDWTPFMVEPTWLDLGDRYAIVLTTTGDHRVGVATKNDLVMGTFMATTDGVAWAAEIEKDMCCRAWSGKFDSSRVTVELGSVSLAGGMRALQFAQTGFVPEGTDLVLEARIGSDWRVVGEVDETIFGSLPNLVPLRLVFVGSVYNMPAINLGKSRLIASRPRTTSVHFSTIRTIGDGTAETIRVSENAKGFDEDENDWIVELLHGASYATVATATSVATGRERPNGRRTRTWTFEGLPDIPSYRIKTTLVSTSIDHPFAVTQRRDDVIA